jgi:hypothetical protein
MNAEIIKRGAAAHRRVYCLLQIAAAKLSVTYRRHHRMKPPRRKEFARRRGKAQRPKSGVSLRPVPGREAWELVHPRCARVRAEDMEEVEAMLAAGETEVARDELRWLLDGCSDFIAAHRVLGELALEENDLQLARGHFGYAYEIGRRAFPGGAPPGPLPYELPANQGFLEAAKGLAWCLRQLGEVGLAKEVVKTMLDCDLSDPLGVRLWA